MSKLFFLSSIALASTACTGSTTRSTSESEMLGTAASFLVLGASTITSTGATLIEGDLGLSPGTAITGFPPGDVVGNVHLADAVAEQAQVDLGIALATLMNEPCEHTLTNAELGGAVLTPGVYCFESSSAQLTGELTLDAEGDADARFVFQIGSTLTTASASSIIRINGGSDCNTFWALGSSATLGTETSFRGSIVASASITATTGATISGRLLAHTGAVTMDDNTVSLVCDQDTGGPDGGVDVSVDGGVIEPDAPVEDMSSCGDNIVDEGEQCDDGANVDGDGCSAACTIELPELPEPVCGNGNVEIGEACDDANTNDFDGCSNACDLTT